MDPSDINWEIQNCCGILNVATSGENARVRIPKTYCG
jgi:hypothetical protein